MTKEIAGYELPEHVKEIADTFEQPPLKVASKLLKNSKQITVRKPADEDGLGMPVKSIAGHVWQPKGELQARGPRPVVDVMVIGTDPSKLESDYAQLFIDDAGMSFMKWLRELNMNPEQYYYTNVMRWPRSGSNVLVWEWKENAWFLHHEIKLCDPDYLLLLGTNATKKIMDLKISDVQGQAREWKFPYGTECTIISAASHTGVHRSPQELRDFMTDVSVLKSLKQTGSVPGELDTSGYEYIYNVDELKDKVDMLIEESNRRKAEGIDQQLYSIDLEWGKEGGEDVIRTFQLSWEIGKSIAVVLRDKDLEDCFTPSVEDAWEQLRRLLLRDEVRVIGQNFRGAEAPHLLDEMGHSLMDKLEIDTMLADHLREENTTCALSRMNLRYTNMGPYDQPLEEYIEEHELSLENDGVRYIPDEELLPYAAADTDCVLRCWEALKEELDEGQLELFFSTIMPVQLPLWEIEQEGLVAHEDRMEEFTALFNEESSRLKRALQKRVEVETGKEDFNPGSWQQVAEVLYDKIGMTPIMTTDGRKWEEVEHMPKEELESKGINPSTDKDTLAILDQKCDHPLPKMISEWRAINKVSTGVFKPYETKDGEQVPQDGSLHSYVEDDGRVHTEIGCLVRTGRRCSRNPNLQNLANRQMTRYRKIIGKDIPEIRSCLAPPKGWLMVENDFSQAELRVLAHLSKDENLIAALEDPMRDMHAERAIDMFNLDKPPSQRQEIAPDGPVWSDDLDINPKVWCKKNGYGSQRNTAKAPSFSWIYGVTPFGLWTTLRESGVDCSISDCEEWLQNLDSAYPQAAQFQEKQANKAEDPGHIITPWKRKKHLYIMEDSRDMSSQGREAANFAIQSTVADLLAKTLIRAQTFREEMGLSNRICLDLHDAMYNFVKPEEIEVYLSKYMPKVADITIPVLDVSLQYESSIYTHSSGWEQKPSVAELEDLGVPDYIASKYGTAA